MKNAFCWTFIGLMLVLGGGCATAPSSEELAVEYLAKAQSYEAQGDLVSAYEQYQLALTVAPQNATAKTKSAELHTKLLALAEEHYQTGLQYYKMGQYTQARQAFLTALRYNPDHAGAAEKMAAFETDGTHAQRYIEHTVQPGESISSIAALYYGDYRKFHIIARYNDIKDATRLKVGQVLKVPVIEGTPIIADAHEIKTVGGAAAAPGDAGLLVVKRYVLHVVQPGDTLSKIAEKYYGNLKLYDVIARFNGLGDATGLRVGQTLKVPETEDARLIAGDAVSVASASPAAAATETAPPPYDAGSAAAEEGSASDDNMAAYLAQGLDSVQKEDYDGAITEFAKVLGAEPDHPEARRGMAQAYYLKGRQAFENGAYPQASAALEKTLEFNPACPDCRSLIDQSRQKMQAVGQRDQAVMLFREKKYEAAIASFEILARADPQDTEIRGYLAKAHYQQGLIWFDKEDYLKARDAFQTAIKYDPKCDKCEQNIAKSESMFKDLHYRQGLDFFQKEDLNGAIAEWEKVYELDPKYRDVQRNLEKARTLLERLESIKRSQGTTPPQP
jgi:tetratricopeptide (TPR) repeat protein